MSTRHHRVAHWAVINGQRATSNLSLTDGRDVIGLARELADTFHAYEFTARTGERLYVAHARFLPGGPKRGFSEFSAGLDITYTFEVAAEAVASLSLAPTEPDELDPEYDDMEEGETVPLSQVLGDEPAEEFWTPVPGCGDLGLLILGHHDLADVNAFMASIPDAGDGCDPWSEFRVVALPDGSPACWQQHVVFKHDDNEDYGYEGARPEVVDADTPGAIAATVFEAAHEPTADDFHQFA